jgi:MtN3 and saliva related transmembrane protein
MVTWTTAIGLIAAALTTTSIVPQALKSWKTRRTKDVSLPMFVLLDMGMALWLIYGLLIYDIPIIAANVVGMVFVSSIVGLKIKYG